MKLVLQKRLTKTEKMEIRGRDLLTGLPKTIEISSDEIAEALRESITQIIDGVKKTLETTPPELSVRCHGTWNCPYWRWSIASESR